MVALINNTSLLLFVAGLYVLAAVANWKKHPVMAAVFFGFAVVLVGCASVLLHG